MSVDLYVTCCIGQLRVFLSPFPDLSAKGVDELFHMWDFPGLLYAYPTTSLLAAVLGRIRATSSPVLSLATAWPRQPWYSFLMELPEAHVVRLPFEQFPLLQGNFTRPSSEMYKTLLGTGSEDRDSLRTLSASWLSRYSLHRVLSTIESGTFSVLGVQRDRSFLSLSL